MPISVYYGLAAGSRGARVIRACRVIQSCGECLRRRDGFATYRDGVRGCDRVVRHDGGARGLSCSGDPDVCGDQARERLVV